MAAVVLRHGSGAEAVTEATNFGFGEPSRDTFFSADHHPSPNEDPRDKVMRAYTFEPCPEGGSIGVVSGQDERGKGGNKLYAERNGKFICNVDRLKAPCVVYSLGSWDEISFEVGLYERGLGCDVHTFDISKISPVATQKRYNFTAHMWGVGASDRKNIKRVDTIMKQLGHTFIDIFKIDIEGAEEHVLPSMVNSGILEKIAVIAPEFHSPRTSLPHGFQLLVKHGWQPAFGRREDRCPTCVEAMFFNPRLPAAYWRGEDPRPGVGLGVEP